MGKSKFTKIKITIWKNSKRKRKKVFETKKIKLEVLKSEKIIGLN